jgi:hypothetical protein
MTPRPLELDYIAPPRRPVWLGLAVLAISLAVAAGLVLRYGEAQQELQRLQTEGGLVLNDSRAQRPVPKERLDEESRAAEAVVRQLTLPWATLITTVEQAASRDVAILQLQPDPDQRVLRLTAEARHRDAMFDYVRRLGAAKGLGEVHLLSHQVQREDPQRPIQFSVQAAIRELR